MTHPLFSLIRTLEEMRLWFRIEKVQPDALMITVTLVGERVEISIFEDGHLEYSRFRGDESVEDDNNQLLALLRKDASGDVQKS